MGDLLLLRHAEAASAAGMPDFQRPLTRRGRADAAALGRRLRDAGPAVDVALVSGAVRARQTHTALGLADHDVHVEPALHRADTDEVLVLLAALAGRARRVLVVGHNPTLHQLCRSLLVAEQRPRVDRFDPGTLAWLQLDEGWDDVRAGRAQLVVLDRPG